MRTAHLIKLHTTMLEMALVDVFETLRGFGTKLFPEGMGEIHIVKTSAGLQGIRTWHHCLQPARNRIQT